MYISKECAPQYYVHRVFVEPYYACKVVNWFTHYRRKYKKKTEKEKFHYYVNFLCNLI